MLAQQRSGGRRPDNGAYERGDNHAFPAYLAGSRLPAASLLALFGGAVMCADKRAIIGMKDVNITNRDNAPLHRATVVCAEPELDAMRAVAEQSSAAITSKRCIYVNFFPCACY